MILDCPKTTQIRTAWNGLKEVNHNEFYPYNGEKGIWFANCLFISDLRYDFLSLHERESDVDYASSILSIPFWKLKVGCFENIILSFLW